MEPVERRATVPVDFMTDERGDTFAVAEGLPTVLVTVEKAANLILSTKPLQGQGTTLKSLVDFQVNDRKMFFGVPATETEQEIKSTEAQAMEKLSEGYAFLASYTAYLGVLQKLKISSKHSDTDSYDIPDALDIHIRDLHAAYNKWKKKLDDVSDAINRLVQVFNTVVTPWKVSAIDFQDRHSAAGQCMHGFYQLVDEEKMACTEVKKRVSFLVKQATEVRKKIDEKKSAVDEWKSKATVTRYNDSLVTHDPQFSGYLATLADIPIFCQTLHQYIKKIIWGWCCKSEYLRSCDLFDEREMSQAAAILISDNDNLASLQDSFEKAHNNYHLKIHSIQSVSNKNVEDLNSAKVERAKEATKQPKSAEEVAKKHAIQEFHLLAQTGFYTFIEFSRVFNEEMKKVQEHRNTLSSIIDKTKAAKEPGYFSFFSSKPPTPKPTQVEPALPIPLGKPKHHLTDLPHPPVELISKTPLERAMRTAQPSDMFTGRYWDGWLIPSAEILSENLDTNDPQTPLQHWLKFYRHDRENIYMVISNYIAKIQHPCLELNASYEWLSTLVIPKEDNLKYELFLFEVTQFKSRLKTLRTKYSQAISPIVQDCLVLEALSKKMKYDKGVLHHAWNALERLTAFLRRVIKEDNARLTIMEYWVGLQSLPEQQPHWTALLAQDVQTQLAVFKLRNEKQEELKRDTDDLNKLGPHQVGYHAAFTQYTKTKVEFEEIDRQVLKAGVISQRYIPLSSVLMSAGILTDQNGDLSKQFRNFIRRMHPLVTPGKPNEASYPHVQQMFHQREKTNFSVVYDCFRSQAMQMQFNINLFQNYLIELVTLHSDVEQFINLDTRKTYGSDQREKDWLLVCHRFDTLCKHCKLLTKYHLDLDTWLKKTIGILTKKTISRARYNKHSDAEIRTRKGIDKLIEHDKKALAYFEFTKLSLSQLVLNQIVPTIEQCVTSINTLRQKQDGNWFGNDKYIKNPLTSETVPDFVDARLTKA